MFSGSATWPCLGESWQSHVFCMDFAPCMWSLRHVEILENPPDVKAFIILKGETGGNRARASASAARMRWPLLVLGF